MSNATRTTILQRLRVGRNTHLAGLEHTAPTTATPTVLAHAWDRDERVRRFTERMSAVRAEVHAATPETWLDVLSQLCADKALNNLLLSPQTQWGQAIHAQAARFPTLRAYDQPIEAWKQEMFYGIDASLTSTLGGIAETGSLILWPDSHEPRQMSLVPPVHFAILERDKLYTTFAEAVQAQDWAGQGMPTNALLISGPSKSADIAQVLAYGVHGPKELVVILV